MKKIQISFILLLTYISSMYASNIMVYTAQDISTYMVQTQPGDTLTMANGVWNNQNIQFIVNGTEEAPIVLRAEEPGEVILTGSSLLRISGSWAVVDGLFFKDGSSSGQGVIEFRSSSGARANNCRLTNTAIVDYNPSSKTINYKWVSLYGKNNRVDHCHFTGKNHDGTTLVVWLSSLSDRDNHHRIDNNYFGYRPPLGFNGGETIRIGTSDYSMTDSRTLVEYNLFERCDGETEIISNKSCENEYRHNTFRNNEGCLTLRHGNRCIIDGNFFFGEGNSDAGGVRIIGEDHVVTNNYFQDMYGDGYTSALTIVKGVENSPLNRYFQVQRALVAFNTFYNCRYTMNFGYGSSDDQTLPPLDCTIANNAVYSPYYDVVYIEDSIGEPVNFTWEGNIFYGKDGGDVADSAYTWIDPLLVNTTDELYRPELNSPLIGAAVGDYSTILTDIDGHSRGISKDVGADQHSNEDILYRPLHFEDVGLNWDVPEVIIPVPGIVNVSSDMDLVSIFDEALDGDTLNFTGSGEIYNITEPIIVDKKILIKGLENGQKPILTFNNSTYSTPYFFEIRGGGDLTLDYIEFDGLAGSDSPAKYFIRTDDTPFSQLYSLKIINSEIHDIVFEDEGMVLRTYEGTKADMIEIQSSRFWNIGRYVLSLAAENENSGLYNANEVIINNSSFWDVGKEVVLMYGGDDNLFLIGPSLYIGHSTFINCGYLGTPVINPRYVEVATIENSNFVESSPGAHIVELYSMFSSINYCNIYNSGSPEMISGAILGSNIYNVNPQFIDEENNDFTLISGSSYLSLVSSDGTSLGDPYWYELTVSGIEPSLKTSLVDKWTLLDNYPNPFNNVTKIEMILVKSEAIGLGIYDINGREIKTLYSGFLEAGQHSFTFDSGSLSSGIYFYKLQSSSNMIIKKMTLIK